MNTILQVALENKGYLTHTPDPNTWNSGLALMKSPLPYPRWTLCGASSLGPSDLLTHEPEQTTTLTSTTSRQNPAKKRNLVKEEICRKLGGGYSAIG